MLSEGYSMPLPVCKIKPALSEPQLEASVLQAGADPKTHQKSRPEKPAQVAQKLLTARLPWVGRLYCASLALRSRSFSSVMASLGGTASGSRLAPEEVVRSTTGAALRGAAATG